MRTCPYCGKKVERKVASLKWSKFNGEWLCPRCHVRKMRNYFEKFAVKEK
jgi:rubredoxin